MTYEEAQKVIYEMICLGLLTPKEDEALHIAYQVLEKQIPKKPMITILTNVRAFKCPSCGGYRVHSYCNDCGQKLDWSEKLK